MTRRLGSAMPKISSPGDGYRTLASVILFEPISIATGEIEGNKDAAVAFLETKFASVLLAGLNVDQSWLLSKLLQ
jgi:hypothetical protein